MSPITGPELGLDFASALPLSQSASATLARAFEMGWLDPSKLHHDSAKLRNLIEESRESIASNLGVLKSELEFVGEVGFGYWAALSGALSKTSRPFIHGATDRQVVHAFAREHAEQGHEVRTLTCGSNGRFDYESASDFDRPWIFWQATNRETGVEQQIPQKIKGNLIADMTASFDPKRMPGNWAVALWDPRSFAGPEGLAILAINSESEWRSPIPPMDKRRLFGSFSKPLLLVTAIALEDWSKELVANRANLQTLNQELRTLISNQITDVQLVGDSNSCDPRNLAIVIAGVIGEELLRALDQRGIKVDAGSACGAGALSPSHVLEAMGLGLDGQIRLTLKTAHTKSGLEELVKALAQEVVKLRA